ncbi:unnamed protein product [Paramecium octaurelia]|uniref:Uncharacterized protein n=1 Tax=Paramecium octaurelia TaxID=43137 RepID=A0A8S1TZS3_PAROT|nr:unnamed protein product [Paramecium octaurelia]
MASPKNHQYLSIYIIDSDVFLKLLHLRVSLKINSQKRQLFNDIVLISEKQHYYLLQFRLDIKLSCTYYLNTKHKTKWCYIYNSQENGQIQSESQQIQEIINQLTVEAQNNKMVLAK